MHTLKYTNQTLQGECDTACVCDTAILHAAGGRGGTQEVAISSPPFLSPSIMCTYIMF